MNFFRVWKTELTWYPAGGGDALFPPPTVPVLGYYGGPMDTMEVVTYNHSTCQWTNSRHEAVNVRKWASIAGLTETLKIVEGNAKR